MGESCPQLEQAPARTIYLSLRARRDSAALADGAFDAMDVPTPFLLKNSRLTC